MFNKEQKTIELSEKKFSLEYLVRLYKEERLHFPQVPRRNQGREIVSDLIKAIRIGIPMPVMYVSELQNGDFLILEAEDRLIYLLKYIQGDFCVDMEEIHQRNGRYYFYELEELYPRFAGTILRTAFIFQIIDYRTPKHLHMEVGLFHEKWNINREQAIRDELYSGPDIEVLRYFVEKAGYNLGMYGSSLHNEYTMLYMMLFWGIYKDILSVDRDMSEQELLDVIISELFDERYRWSDFLKVLDICSAVQNNISIRRSYHMLLRDKKFKGKMLGLLICYYDMCQYTQTSVDKIVDGLFNDSSVMRDIRAMKITVENIEMFLNIGKEWSQ